MKTLHVIIMLVFAGFLAPGWSGAADKVVVIPLMSHQSKPLKNVVTVAKKNGDFTDPVAAVNSITDAAVDNPYLIVIGPGVYTLTEALQIPGYVSMTGSGLYSTTLQGTLSDDQSLFTGSLVRLAGGHSSLSDLFVTNRGGGKRSTAVFVGYNSELHQLSVQVSGSEENVGVYSNGGKVEHVSILATGGERATGILSYSSQPPIKHISITAHNAHQINIGVDFSGSARLLSDAEINATGDTYAIGVRYKDCRNSEVLDGVRIQAAGAGESRGIFSYTQNHFSPVVLKRSTVFGEDRAILVQNYSNTNNITLIRASQSTIVGGVEISGNGGEKSECIACDDNSGHELNSVCE